MARLTLEVVCIGEEKKSKSQVLRLALAPSTWKGAVKLYAVDEFGVSRSRGAILRITPDGEIHMYNNIDRSLGLSLDERGQVKLV